MNDRAWCRVLPAVTGIVLAAAMFSSCGGDEPVAGVAAVPTKAVTITATPPTPTATTTVTATVTATVTPADTSTAAADDPPSGPTVQEPAPEPVPRTSWHASHRAEILAILNDYKRLLRAAANAADAPRKLLTVAEDMDALSSRLNELGMAAPSSELSQLLWDLSDAQQSTSYAAEDFARASLAQDLYGMELANEDAEAARAEMAAALRTYAAYARSHS
jgi:hypothetical protein